LPVRLAGVRFAAMLIDDLRAMSGEVCASHGVRRLGVFGSVARGESGEGSDVDVAVEFDGEDRLFDRFMGLKDDLERRLRRSVDLVILRSIRNPVFRRAVERDLRILYG
jgi:predicted nucleotidyltransferase